MAEYENTLLTSIKIDATQAMSDLNKMSAALNKVSTDVANVSKKTSGMVDLLSTAIKGVAALELGRWALEAVKGVTALATATADLADKAESLNTSAQTLQGFGYAAIQSGSDMNTMIRALDNLSVKLGQMGENTSAATKALRALGVSQGDNVASALNQIADQFSLMTDASQKAAYAAAIFGEEVGRKMLPVLSQGSKGLADMAAEAEKLGYVLDKEVVEASKQFDNNLNKMGAILKSVGNVILAELIPSMNKYSERLIDNIDKLGKWKGALQTLWQNLDLPGNGPFQTVEEQLADLTKELEYSQGKVKLFREEFHDPVGAQGWEREVERLTKKIQDLGGAITQVSSLLPLEHVTLPTSHVETVNSKLKETATHVSKIKSAWDSWMDSLKSSAETAAMVPKQITYLTTELVKLTKAGKEGSAQWNIYFDELKKLAPEFVDFITYVDPVTKAFGELNDEVADFFTTQSNNQAILEAVTARMKELEAAGLKATKAYEALEAKQMDLAGSLDPVVKAANDLKKSMTEARDASSLLIEAYGRGLITIDELLNKVNDSTKKLTKDMTFSAESFIRAGETFTSGFVDKWVDGLGKAEMSFSDFLLDLTKMIAKWLTNALVQKFFTSLVSAYGGMGFAKGGAWNAAGVQFMAKGGVLNSPTFFSNSGRLAVAGEAGPEAVVPLQRTPAGDLGVAASPVVITINNTMSEVAEVRASASDNADGSKQIAIYVEQKVKSMFSSGQMDRTMSSSYGLVRQAR